ncbi:MAG: hypothetical protein JWO63_653, partial [Frankiales bacterium]|nr:hypothetical protein [Frankiales bacterium]
MAEGRPERVVVGSSVAALVAADA